MKRIFYLQIFLILLGTQLICVNPTTAAAEDWSSWKNFYAVCWVDGAQNNIKYAKQMGYDYIGINNLATADYSYNWIANRAGLKFYLVNPYWNKQYVFQGYDNIIPMNRSYTIAEKNFFEKYMAWKSTDAFPNNLATGWFDGAADRPYAQLDFQQQAVVDYAVEKIVLAARSFENTSIGFSFAGVMFDVPRLKGDFHVWPNTWVNMSYWTGSDSSLLHGGITHEYATYQDGLAAFFKKLKTRIKQAFPNSKLIHEPYKLYRDDWDDEWIKQIKDRTDKNELTPDFLSQEGGGTEFVDDVRNFNSGVSITKDMVGSSQPLNWSTDNQNRKIAAVAGINGAWYNWFGRLGDMSVRSITAVSPSLKLIRVLPNWDNLNNITLASRSWNGNVYQSAKSYASSDMIHSRHWKTGKLFGVFLTTAGFIKLNSGEAVTSTQRTDGYFIESGDGSADVSIVGNEIRLKSFTNINKGYIFTLSSSAPNPTDTITYLSNLTWTSVINGWGPAEKDASNGESLSGDGKTITLNGTTYAKGLGAHAYSEIVYNLNSRYATFLSDIGVDDEIADGGSVIFQVWLDGTNVYDSGMMTASSATKTVNVSVSGKNTLKLIVTDGGDGKSADHADWANARLTSSGSDIIAPAVTITSPTTDSTYATTQSSINVSGTASDNVGVTSITWENSANSASGTASGTASWSISDIALLPGANLITVSAKDAANNVSTDMITVTYSATVSPAPVITSALSSTGTAATTFSYQITAANGPTSFNAAGLPAGLSVSTGTGRISGTPTTVGTSSVAISAANAVGTGVSTLTLSVYSACDLNRDALTNVVDVQLQVNQALGATACTSDLNRDGSCNVIDVQRDVNASLGGQCLLGP